MSRTSRTFIIIAASCSALGLAGFGLLNPPTDPHARPAAKEPPRLPSVTPKEKAKPAAPAKPEPKPPAPSKPEHDDGHHDADNAPEPAHGDAHEAPAQPATPAPPPAVAPPAKAVADENTDGISADDAMKFLRDGNERWINNQPQAPHTDSARREEVAQGQKPFATILTCADSRLPVERIFDRGVGDLFVVRVAGNVVSGEVAGSIEYGAEHLKVPLLIIMGHTKCGAVAAAAAGGDPGGNIGTLIEKITPAVARAKQQAPSASAQAIITAAIKENVWQSMFDLFRTSAEARHMIKDGKLRVVGAVCDVATGRVEWIGQHPWQDALVDAFDAKGAPHKTETAGAESHH